MSRFNAPIRNPDLSSKEWQQFFAKLKFGENTFTPVWTGLTLGGGGSVAYQGRYFRVGPLVFFQVLIDSTGGRTTDSTLNVTYFPAPLEIAYDNVCSVATVGLGTDLGMGTIRKATNRIYTPTWGATAQDIVISGWYETNA